MSATLDCRKRGQIPRDLTTFATLPSEVRDMIWEEVCKFSNVIETKTSYERYVAAGRNRLRVTTESHDGPRKVDYIIHYKVPSVLHVCAQSRHVALQRYRLLTGNPSNDQKLYINYNNDIMLYPDWFSVSIFGIRRDRPHSTLHPDPVDIFQVDWQSVIIRHSNSASCRQLMPHSMRHGRNLLPAVRRVVMERNVRDTEKIDILTNLFNSLFTDSGVSVKPTLDVWTPKEIDEWLSGIALVGYKSSSWRMRINVT
ncbi:hypothetical protein CJF31_00005814 [Rutstroemia sp. NJR-2017a BVV2]|nr:hypothetical protein CJF31_00005814 [Rutstroemia sp. NJR-2017a BVV2]